MSLHIVIYSILLFSLMPAGQEQDSLGGGFQRDQSYSGEITQLNFWDSYLSRDAIRGVSPWPCCVALAHAGNGVAVVKWGSVGRGC